MRAPRLTPSLLATLALALAGCASTQLYRPLDSVGHLRSQFSERVGADRAAEIAIPFEVDQNIREAAQSRLSPSGSDAWRVEQMIDFIFNWLELEYTLMPTHSAVDTFRLREGNCLSFVNLFVGVAREQRMAPFYVEVEDYQRWNYRDGSVVSHGHIVAGLYVEGELSTFDFLPYSPKSYRDFEPIDDLRATAHYYNNLGAEALLEGELEAAAGYLQVAVDLAPDFDKAINNLGVSLQRLDRFDEAFALYERGLELDPENIALLTNLARAYQQLGRTDEAESFLTRIESLDHSNPFFYVYRGELALHQDDMETALQYMIKALRRDSEIPEVHLGLAKVYFAAGNLKRARHHIERALKLDATHKEARQFAMMMAGPPSDKT